ncbi:MAG: hypothetical protein QM482_09670 [Sulfurospirillum sp.]
MAKTQKIQYINPTDLSLLVYDGKHFQNINKKENLYTVSRVLYENATLYSFKIPSVQANDDLTSLVEIKMYEEAGLDVNKSYKISYLVKELDFNEMCLIEAFAVDIEILKEAHKESIKKVKYIDFLVFPFFAFKTFYVNKILTPKNDIFVYIGNDEAFLSFYKNGSYISTKSMINLSEMVEKLNAQDIVINLEKLNEILLSKGLKAELYEKSESELFVALESLFSDILTKINNVAMHNRSVFGFDKIERIFFSTKQGRIKGLKEFVAEFGFVNVDVLDFNLFRDKQEVDFLDKVVCSYGFDKYLQNSNKQNITIFGKPPSFLSTQFGKLTLWIFIFLAVLFSVYSYFYFDIQNLQNQENLLQIKYQSIKNRANIYKRETGKKIRDIKGIKKEMQKQDIVFESIKQSIDKLEKMKGKQSRYIDFLASVNQLLQKYRLKAKSIIQTGRTKMTIEVISNYGNRDKIAKFLKSLISEGFVNVRTQEIKLDNDKYISKVEIEHE